MGDLEKTDELFEQLHHKSRNQATSFSPYKLPVHPLSLVRLIAAGQLDQATDLVRSGLSSSSVPVQNYFENQSDLSLINNFCIALLYSGKLNQGFPILRRLIEKFGSEKNEPHSRSVNNEEEGTSHNIEGQGNNNSDAKDNRSESKSNQSLEESLDSSSLTEENILHQSEMLNSLIFNYSTFIELNFGIDCDQIKQDFLNQLIRKFSKSNSSKGSTSSNDPVAPLDLHRFLDLISLNSFKFPASYFNSWSLALFCGTKEWLYYMVHQAALGYVEPASVPIDSQDVQFMLDFQPPACLVFISDHLFLILPWFPVS